MAGVLREPGVLAQAPHANLFGTTKKTGHQPEAIMRAYLTLAARTGQEYPPGMLQIDLSLPLRVLRESACDRRRGCEAKEESAPASLPLGRDAVGRRDYSLGKPDRSTAGQAAGRRARIAGFATVKRHRR